MSFFIVQRQENILFHDDNPNIAHVLKVVYSITFYSYPYTCPVSFSQSLFVSVSAFSFKPP